MSRKAAANFKFRRKRYEIILVPVFICVRKDKIEEMLGKNRNLNSSPVEVEIAPYLISPIILS
jgi:hypothetical protein